MKKIKLFVATIGLLMVSTVAFGQNSVTFIKDTPEYPVLLNDYVDVHIKWIREDGQFGTKQATVSVVQLSLGINLTFDQAFKTYSPVASTQIQIYYPKETHIAIYPGFQAQAIRENDPQYWVVFQK